VSADLSVPSARIFSSGPNDPHGSLIQHQDTTKRAASFCSPTRNHLNLSVDLSAGRRRQRVRSLSDWNPDRLDSGTNDAKVARNEVATKFLTQADRGDRR